MISHICRKLPISDEEFVFLDIGSGRGRVLMLASSYPFKEIIGVEISPLHHRIAEQNLALFKSKSQRCTRVKSICISATDYVPPRDNLIVYMYHPFGGPVLSKLLNKLENATREGDRSVFVCFSAPYLLHGQAVILTQTSSGFSTHRPLSDFQLGRQLDSLWKCEGGGSIRERAIVKRCVPMTSIGDLSDCSISSPS